MDRERDGRKSAVRVHRFKNETIFRLLRGFINARYACDCILTLDYVAKTRNRETSDYKINMINGNTFDSSSVAMPPFSNRNVTIFVPDRVNSGTVSRSTGYLSESSDAVRRIYVLGDSFDARTSRKLERFPVSPENTVIVDINFEHDRPQDDVSISNYVSLKINDRAVSVSRLKVRNAEYGTDDVANEIVVIKYNYFAFLKSEALCNDESILEDDLSRSSLSQFQLLKCIISCKEMSRPTEKHRTVQNTKRQNDGVGDMYNSLVSLTGYSSVCCYLLNTMNALKWSIVSIKRDRKINVKVGNMLSAMILDVVCGFVVLAYIVHTSPSFVVKLFEVIDFIIPNLQNLIRWLMGSPAGLKLNHAFNTMLGNFFLYHVDLWWMFLVLSRDCLEVLVKVFQYLGMLGITFQAAIIADLISLASFHVYCIYIYAARLYNVQISGLIALWRLFLGRKHNPLRGIVDSCHYNHHQLFIGTLGFTVLLFLLPTTIMYYFVFTMFRCIRLGVASLLSWIQYLFQSFPLFLIFLWIVRSPKIAGNICVSLLPHSEDSSVTMIYVEIKIGSLTQLIQKYKPDPVPQPSRIMWGEVLRNLWKGNILNSL